MALRLPCLIIRLGLTNNQTTSPSFHWYDCSILVFMHRKQKRPSPIISYQLQGKLCSFYLTIPLKICILKHIHTVFTHGLQSIQRNKNQLNVTLVYMPVFRRNFDSSSYFFRTVLQDTVTTVIINKSVVCFREFSIVSYLPT